MIEVSFDLDGTLADYDEQLRKDLNNIASPDEPLISSIYYNPPEYIIKRRHMITSQLGWWSNLSKFKLGWDILNLFSDKTKYRIQVLTKGPDTKPCAWKEKVEWCAKYLNGIVDGVTITHDKSLVYARILVDDWPAYIEKWLQVRPRGLVIMPAHPHNEFYIHSNVIRYDGTNIEEVKKAINENLYDLSRT